jgi:hypothetical protein
MKTAYLASAMIVLLAIISPSFVQYSSVRVFAAGLFGREDARIEATMASAMHAHADLVEVKPFWR